LCTAKAPRGERRQSLNVAPRAADTAAPEKINRCLP